MTRLSERIAADVLKASGSGLQNYTMNGSRERIIEAASVADDLLEAVIQYRDDLKRPPTGDSIERRLAMVNAAIRKATGAAA
jgi:hypothetical protein